MPASFILPHGRHSASECTGRSVAATFKPSCPALPRLQAKQQQHSRSLGRLKEQLRWVATETDALKRQLGDRDKQLAALRREGMGASGSGSLAGGASYTSGSWRSGGGGL